MKRTLRNFAHNRKHRQHPKSGYSKEEKIKYQLDHCKYLWEKIKLNQETCDRYFHYFLLFITTPILVLAAVLAKIELNNFQALLNKNLAGAISLTLSAIGFWFYHGANRYRMARLNIFTQLKHVELKHVELYLYGATLESLTKQDEKIKVNFFSTFGADFSVNAVQMITNSFWATTSLFFFGVLCKALLVFIFIFFFASQAYLRKMLLGPAEKTFYEVAKTT